MYTVGLKRRWWFGYKEYEVKAHSWGETGLLLNLVDGSQIHIPGVQTVAVKVYPNFWIHLRSLSSPAPTTLPPVEVAAPRPAAPVVRAGAEAAPAYVEPPPHEYVSPEVKKRAAERVRGILQESGFSEGLS